MPLPRRKNIRLESSLYEDPARIFSITVCTWHRNPWFRNPAYAAALLETLKAGPFAANIESHAYCILPDHVHLLISPKETNLQILIKRWKSYTANRLRKIGLASRCWQRSFHDHALRREEDINAAAEYIVHNPVRAGLVEHWRDYAYSWHRWM